MLIGSITTMCAGCGNPGHAHPTSLPSLGTMCAGCGNGHAHAHAARFGPAQPASTDDASRGALTLA